MCSPLLNTEVTQYRRHNNKFTMSSPTTMKMFIARKKIRLQQGPCSLILTTTAAASAAAATTMTTIPIGLKVLK